MAYYNPYKDDKNKKKTSDNWFINTGIRAGLIGLNVFAIYGMYKGAKGPFVTSLNKIANRQTKKVIQREWHKSNFDIEYEEGSEILREQGILAAHENVSDDELKKLKMPSQTTKNWIQTAEKAMAERGQIRDPSISIEVFIDKITDEVKQKEIDTIFSRLRYEAIEEYLFKVSPEGISDISEKLSSYSKDFSVHREAIVAIHEQFMSEDSEYCRLYLNKLRSLNAAHFLSSSGSKLSVPAVQESLYKRINNYYSSLFYGNLNPTLVPENIKKGLKLPELFGKEPLVTGTYRKINSIDLGTQMNQRQWTGQQFLASKRIRAASEIFQLPLSVKYDRDFQELFVMLNEIKDRPNSGIKGFTAIVEEFERDAPQVAGQLSKTSSYLDINIIPENPTTKGTLQVRIPIVSDLRAPGKTPGSNELITGLVAIGDNFGSPSDDLKHINFTQAAIRNVIKILKSRTLVNEINLNPEKLQRALMWSVATVFNEGTVATPELRDTMVKALGVHFPWVKELVFDRKKPTRQALYRHALESLKTMRRLPKNAVVVAIDFEALSSKNIGVQHTPRDLDTQVYKAGIVAMEMKSGKILGSDELTSTHGLEIIKDKITPQVKSLIAQWTGENNPDEAWKKFVTTLKQDNNTNVKDNLGFLKVVYDRINKMKKQFASQGKEVYFTFKNGWQYDIKFLNQIGDFDRENKNRIIDVQNIAAVRAIGAGSKESLAQKSMLQHVLGDLFSVAPEATKISNIQSVLKLLSKKTRGKLLKSKELTSLLEMNDVDIKGFGAKLHISPRTDSLITLALLRYEHFSYLSNKDLYKDADRIEEILSVGQRPKTISDILKLVEGVTATPLAGYRVGFTGTTSNWSSKLKASIMDIASMIPFGDIAYNRQSEQTLRGIGVGPSMRYYKAARDKKISHWDNIKKFMSPICTQETLDAENILRAEGPANVYSHHVVAKTFVTTNSAFGRENYKAYRNDFVEGIGTEHGERIRITPDMIDKDSLLVNHTMRFYDAVLKEAKKIAAETGIIDNSVLEAASRKITNDDTFKDVWSIKPGLRTPGANGSIKQMAGKFVKVMVEDDSVNRSGNPMPVLVAEIIRQAEGEELRKLPLTSMSGVTKSMVTFSGLITHALSSDKKHGFESLAKFDALDKGFVGWYKDAFMSTVVRHWQDIYLGRDSTSNEKKIAKENLDKIAGDLNGRVQAGTGRIILGPANKRKKLNFKNLDSKQEQIAQRYLGGISLSSKQIEGYMKGAGIVHTKESAELWNSYMCSAGKNSQSLDAARSIIDQLKKGAVDKKYDPQGFLNNLKTEGKLSVANELDYFVRQQGIAKEGNAKFFEMGKLVSGENQFVYIPGSTVIDVSAWSNIDVGMQARNATIKIQRNYLTDILMDKSNDHSLVQWLKENSNHRTNRKYAKAFKSFMIWRDMLFNKTITHGKVTLNELKLLFPSSETLQRQAAKRDSERPHSVQESEIMNQQASVINSMSPDQKTEAIDLNIEATKVATGAIAINTRAENARVYTKTDINRIQDLIKEKGNNGIVSLSLAAGKNDALVIPIEQTIRLMGNLPGHFAGANINTLKEKLIATFKASKTATDKSWYKLDSDGNLHLTHIPLFFHSSQSENFTNYTKDGFFKASDDTKLATDVVEAFRTYYTMMTKTDHRGMVSGPNSDTPEKFLHRQILTYFLSGQTAAKDSRNFNMMQIHAKGTYVFHRNFEEIATAVANLGDPSDEFLKKRFGISDGKQFRDFSKRLLKSRRDTIYMTESLFRKTLQGQIGDSFASIDDFAKSCKDIDIHKVLSGDEVLHGGLFTRFPINQSGADALKRSVIQVIPEKYQKIVGVDNNSFYAHQIYSKYIAADVDADQGAIFLQLNSIMENYNKLRKEQRDDYAKFSTRYDVRHDTEKYYVSTKEKLKVNDDIAIIGFANGKVKLSGYNYSGHHRVVEKSLEDVDLSDVFLKTIKMTAKMAAHSAENFTGDMINGIEKTETSPMIMKQLIGQVTNIAKGRAMSLLQAGVRHNPGGIDPLVSTLNMGLSGMTQKVIDAAKHPEQAAEQAKVLSFMRLMQSPVQHQDDVSSVKKFWLDTTRETVGDEYWNRKIGQSGLTLAEIQETNFDLMMGKLINQDKAERFSRILKIHRKSREDSVFGRTYANLLDLYLSSTNGIDPSVNEALGPEKRTHYEHATDAIDFFDKVSKKFKEGANATFRKSTLGKFGAIGAIAFLGLNLFRPNQLSNSSNPLDAFVSLGHDVNGNPNSISSDVELDRRIPLDTVNASFSKEAYVRLNKTLGGQDNQIKSGILQNMMNNAFQQMGQEVMAITESPQVNYTNYTTFVGNYGTTSIRNKARY